MKNLLFYATLLLLSLALVCSGCTQAVQAEIPTDFPQSDGGNANGPVSPDNGDSTEIPASIPPENSGMLTGKIVQKTDYSILLAGIEPDIFGGLFTLPLEDTIIVDKQDKPMPADELYTGMTVDVIFHGTIIKSYPAEFPSQVYLRAVEQSDDLVGFYLAVIGDLYDVDPGLNSDIDMIAFDLSELDNLSNSEKNALMYIVGEKYGVEAIKATFEELIEQGLISGSFPPYKEDGPTEMPHFEKGIHIAFTDTDFRKDGFTFSVSKWRCALGAYMFCDCEASKLFISPVDRPHFSEWTYTIGSQAIS